MNLASCKPSEFLKQTYRIKKSVETWLKATDIFSIRRNLPKLTPITNDMSEEERAEIFKDNRKKTQEQILKNFNAMLDAVLFDHADKTLEILALCCFVEPAEVDNYTIEFYLENVTELLNNKAVVGFFTSLAQLAQMNSANA